MSSAQFRSAPSAPKTASARGISHTAELAELASACQSSAKALKSVWITKAAGFIGRSDIWHLGCAKESPMPIKGVGSKPNLVVIGLNHRSAPVEVRERFW